MKKLLIVIVLIVAAAGLTWLMMGTRSAENDDADAGLKYAELKEGKGKLAKKGDTVVIHFEGRLKDGTLFESSVKNGKPYAFVLGAGKVIKGLDLGIAGMREGGKRRLIIPPELAYGEDGDEVIPPNATLIFEVQLLKVL